jgi:hypothetical protein
VLLVCGAPLLPWGCEGDTTPADVDARQQPPSEDPAAVQAWLDQRFYETWDKEPLAHISTGPHFGFVRTFVNELAYNGLTSGADQLPRGAVAVKVIYGSDLTQTRGHAVSHKVNSKSALGDGWYWYERFDGNDIMAKRGADTFCAECHIEPPNIDLIKTSFE